ncbi:hypothetical protein SCUCBS95973_002168 [Sporothrix curviconia]|uniref:BZIP domain-containing protein n=1 Tax=Sporothrix curviconia TaxID=1260050 RepID=A0ABP0B4R2_9PEZI
MVSSYSMNSNTFRPVQLSVDTTVHLPQKYFDEDDGILDDSVLDHNAIDSGLEMTPPMAGSRRDSFALGSTFFSPKQEDWQPLEMQSLPTTNPFADQSSTNPFLRMDHQQQQRPHQPQPQPQHHQHHQHHAMPAHLGSWPMTASTSAASGVATPVAHFDGLASDFDSSASVFQRGLQTPFASMGGLFQTVPGLPAVSSTTAAAMASTTSAVSIPMQLSSSNDSVDTQSAMAKRLPPQSPMMRSHNDMRRGDGIRKKNSRFDIPSDRNLNNIDSLISKSTDEHEIKELKQQKRLLRNRQAALDSRQRKKQHTERLEDEKKHYTSVMNDMEQTINDLRMQLAEFQLEKQNIGRYIDNLAMDKEEMIRQHTIETADLRKKVSVLSNHIQILESSAAPAPAMSSHVPGYAGAGASASAMGPFGDIGGLGMETGSDTWEDLFQGMPSVEQQPEQQLRQAAVVKPDPETREVDTTVGPVMASTEKSGTQGGLLFMLFLVGAFVMSNRQMPSMPPVSDEMRVASAELLDNVLKDAGMPDSAPSSSIAPSAVVASASVNANVAAASSSAWVQPTTVEPSMLGQLSDQLIQPTEEQANEQLFSLNAAQYSGVVNYQHPPSVEDTASVPTSQGRRNLADALAAVRSNSKAEVYTRSLLWDQIPSDVVRSFVKMVSEVNTATPGAADGEQ